MKNALIFLFIIFCTAVQAQTRDTSKVDTRPMCTATTQAGTHCKHHLIAPALFCTIHNPDTPRCGAATKSGQPCRRTVKTPGHPCSTHKPKTAAQ